MMGPSIEARRARASTSHKQCSSRFRLSVVIPFYGDPCLPHLLPRLEQLCGSFPQRDCIEFIVVDSKSAEPTQDRCRELCATFGVRYIYHDRVAEAFSLGEARDIGAMHAGGAAVTFLDVDLRVAPNFWDQLLSFMAVFGVGRFKKRFFTVPCIYLTESASAEFERINPEYRVSHFLLRWLYGDRASIETFAPCSSVAVIDRLHYLAVGGHNPDFVGHGYEDFELYQRLISEQGILPKPTEYTKDNRHWEDSAYEGFRAQFSLLGRAALMQNLVCVHLWHPRPVTASFYKKMGANRAKLNEAIEAFAISRTHPTPLTAAECSNQRTLFLGRKATPSARSLKDVFPLLGSVEYANEFDFANEATVFQENELARLLSRKNISRVLFPNPYRNTARIQIYHWCRRNSFPYIVFERGALPHSWFFDPNGFGPDSASYRRENWDINLSKKEWSEAVAYVRRFIADGETLEAQGCRRGGAALSRDLGIEDKRVLLVPLQRPSDTVTTHFAGNIGSWDNFCKFVDRVGERLSALGWIVLAKVHPYENACPKFEHVRYAPRDTHIMDLLELADSVAVMNSSVGLYAAMFQKPCFIFARAFYAFEGLNEVVAIPEVNSFCSKVVTGMTVEAETLYRFVHFLRNCLYSFGAAAYESREEADGSLRKTSTSIDFYEIRLPGIAPRMYERDSQGRLSTSAPIFERFHHFFRQQS